MLQQDWIRDRHICLVFPPDPPCTPICNCYWMIVPKPYRRATIDKLCSRKIVSLALQTQQGASFGKSSRIDIFSIENDHFSDCFGTSGADAPQKWSAALRHTFFWH
jgi:hypothetical protein